jgi:hypothetical protein
MAFFSSSKGDANGWEKKRVRFLKEFLERRVSKEGLVEGFFLQHQTAKGPRG